MHLCDGAILLAQRIGLQQEREILYKNGNTQRQDNGIAVSTLSELCRVEKSIERLRDVSFDQRAFNFDMKGEHSGVPVAR